MIGLRVFLFVFGPLVRSAKLKMEVQVVQPSHSQVSHRAGAQVGPSLEIFRVVRVLEWE